MNPILNMRVRVKDCYPIDGEPNTEANDEVLRGATGVIVEIQPDIIPYPIMVSFDDLWSEGERLRASFRVDELQGIRGRE